MVEFNVRWGRSIVYLNRCAMKLEIFEISKLEQSPGKKSIHGRMSAVSIECVEKTETGRRGEH